MTDAAQLTDEARAEEEAWKRAHGSECGCWKCMHVKMPLVEALDAAQQENEALRASAEAMKEESETLHEILTKEGIPTIDEFDALTVQERLRLLVQKIPCAT